MTATAERTQVAPAADAAQCAPKWRIEGHVIVSCNCDYGCPCNFNALPTKGKCEGGWTWHLTEGNFGEVSLDGLHFSLEVNWPAAIHEGNGEALFLVDERASAQQRPAIETLVGGTAGGPWQVLRRTIATLHGPQFVPYEFRADGYHSSVRAGDVMLVEMEPVRNRVTQAEAHPRIVLPQGFIFKDGMAGRTKTFWIKDGIRMDHSGQYAAFAEIDYQGP
jgi:hypothetical protein